MAGRHVRENWKALEGAHKDPWIWERLPAAPGGRKPGCSFYPGLLRELKKKLGAKSKIDFDSHHQGFASYVDAWFYRDNDDFRDRQLGGKNCFAGLAVTLWRFGPYYILGEYTKSWGARTGTSGLPSFEGIDRFPTPAVRELSTVAENKLAEGGLVRLHRSQLATPLPEFYRGIPSNLRDGEPRLFDAIFFWND